MILLSFCDLDEKPEKYTVSFHPNGASGMPPQAIIVTEDKNNWNWDLIVLPDKGNLDYAGKNFYGWNTSPDGSGKLYSTGSYVYARNTTYYAQWEQFGAPQNLKMVNVNEFVWDAPNGYDNLGIFGKDGDSRIYYCVFYRRSDSTNNFNLYGLYLTPRFSHSAWDSEWGTFEFFVAIGVVKYSHYDHADISGYYNNTLNYQNNYSIAIGPHSNVITERIHSASEVLPPPTGLRAEVLSQYTSHLTWDAVWPTTLYRVYRSNNGNNWEVYKDYCFATEIDVFQNPGSTIYYRVAGINGTLLIVGTPSESVSVTTPGGYPDIVTGFEATASSTTSIDLTWNESARATAYEIYYKTGSSGMRYLADTIKGKNYTHTGLIPNTDYTYDINAINNDFDFTYYSSTSYWTLPSVSCSTSTSASSTEPTILTLINNTSNHISSIQINNGSNMLSSNLNKNTCIQIFLDSETYNISLFDTEGKCTSFPITINNDSVRCTIVDGDWPQYSISLRNNYSYAIAKTFVKKSLIGNWGINFINIPILTNNSRVIDTFEQGSYEVMAESLEYYRVTSGVGANGIAVSGVLDGYRPVWYIIPSFLLNEDITVTVQATGWVKIIP